MHKRLVWILVAALVSLAAAQAPAVSKVGSLMSFTGALAEFGPAINNGVNLAADQLNAAATAELGGPIVELITEDSATSPASGVDRARKLINTDNVVAIVGALSSGVTVAVAESVAIPSNVVMVSPASTSPLVGMLPDTNDYIYRTVASDALQGVVGAQLARGEIIPGHSFDTASIIYVNNPYGQGLAEAFEAAFTKRGGKVLAKVAHPEEPQPTYAAQLEQALAGNPGVLIAISYPGQATVYLQESRDLYDYTSWQFVDGTKSVDIIDAVGADVVDGLYGTAPGADPNWAGFVKFSDDYNAAYGQRPPLPYIDTGYDAMAVIGLAIAKSIVDGVPVTSQSVRDRMREVANPDGEKVGVGDFQHAIALMKSGKDINYTGAAGEVDFDANGDVVTPVEIWQFKGGTIVSVMVRTASEIPAE
ncbi:MAG: ABC transporter substrate-binding protein [Truepera sp.]|nr:ABC transporter substrate-binding protein [Truepera sp.]HRN18234.1 ABC transporter substrate-binding protein [Trueperaceae bacterium]HRQ10371.1 ABC transporter substrate-binding protein [Trueperaceae bacterium]